MSATSNRPTFFAFEGEHLLAQGAARSLWSEEQIHGVAIGGLMGRALEKAAKELGRGDLRPARYSTDLFRPAIMGDPITFESDVVRNGPRLVLIDVRLIQQGETKCRASGLFLLPTENPQGNVWEPEFDLTAPELAPVADHEGRMPHFYSPERGWNDNFFDHQDGGRRIIWQTGLPVVAGEETTPFQAACATADSVTLATNWGDKGVEYINTDVMLTMARMPVDRELGFASLNRKEFDGIASGAAVVFDREGVIGTVMTTSIANSRRTVDFTKVNISEEGEASQRV